jgi:hypothetical protein
LQILKLQLQRLEWGAFLMGNQHSVVLQDNLAVRVRVRVRVRQHHLVKLVVYKEIYLHLLNLFGGAGQFSSTSASTSATTSSRQAGMQGNLFGGPPPGNLFGAAGQLSSTDASASASAIQFAFGAPSQQSSTRTTAFGASLHPPAASTAEDNMDVDGSSPDEMHF